MAQKPDNARRDSVLGRMLRTPPTPHKPVKRTLKPAPKTKEEIQQVMDEVANLIGQKSNNRNDS